MVQDDLPHMLCCVPRTDWLIFMERLLYNEYSLALYFYGVSCDILCGIATVLLHSMTFLII